MSLFLGFTRFTLLLTSLLVASVVSGFSTNDEQNTIEVFESARPSVVYVTNEQFARHPFSFDIVSLPGGAGTGFVWSQDGYIVTNYHVVENASRIMITLQDQTHLPAKVVGLAPERDIAVLKIEASKDKLFPLPLGDSQRLQVGRKVLAIGNPFGLDATLTTGVVSALGREIESPTRRTITNVIQTDAAINPGNSGGPLLNSQGELIGVNTMIYSPSGASAGIGFAIPVNTVKEVVPELIQHGKIVRPVLGIRSAPDQWARQMGIEGIAVLRVEPNSAAAQAGLEGVKRNRFGQTLLGDVIVAINDDPVSNDDQLLSTLEKYRAGQVVKVSFVRQGKLLTKSITLSAPKNS